MSRAIVIVALFAFIAAASAQSICDKYVALTGNNATTLIGLVVDGAIGSVTVNPVTKQYFDGSLAPEQWPGATNYTDPASGAALARLRTLLVQFFGLALNCTDGTIGSYTGRNMYNAHIAMPIGPVQFESFNRQVINVGSTVLSAADQLAVLATLNTLKPQICNQPACQVNGFVPASICDRYSAALNLTNWGLIDYVVAGVIANVTTPGSPLKKYFDGTIPGTTNFTSPANAAALTNLRNHLDEFFGAAGVLNCSYVNYPTYKGRTLVASHANLQIDGAAFTLFNTVLLNILAANNVATADLNAVNAVLVSTRSAIVTVGNSTSTTTGASSTTTGNSGSGSGATGTTSTSAASSVFMSAIAFFLVFAVYLF